MAKTNFSYKNYFEPTPKNLQYFATSMRYIVAGVAGSSLIMEANKWVTFSILFVGLVLDEAIKFFGRIQDDQNQPPVA